MDLWPHGLRCPFSKTRAHISLLFTATECLAPRHKDNQIVMVFQIELFFQITSFTLVFKKRGGGWWSWGVCVCVCVFTVGTVHHRTQVL